MMNNIKAQSLQSLLESDRESNDSFLAESLQLDIEELDDVEYSIPPLTLPTLESILSDLDGDSDVYSETATVSQTPTQSLDDQTQKTGTILRHIVLQGVTSQLNSASDRVNAGLASSVVISDTMIAVGTMHGHILAFDNVQTLRWCCQEHTSQGAVSALAFNHDCTRLLAGFSRSFIIMIDTASGDIIRSINDAITPSSGVLNLKWTENTSTALCSDSGGSVWTLNFTRRLGIRSCDSRCIFSGARGEVCTIEPLLFQGMNHPLKMYSIAALATLSKFVVVTIRPRLKVIKFQWLIGPSDCLPLLAWQMVLIQATDSSRIIDPVLASARGNNLYFHQISIRSGKVSLISLRHIVLSYNLLSLHWLGPKSLACLDSSEILHLNDVRTNKELECIDLASAKLVYGSAQFKGFATGGNVSPALALAGTYACYNSVTSNGTQLYILGARSLHSVTIRTWSDRISYLVANQRWNEACTLAIDGYHLACERKNRKQIAKRRILQLVDEYLSATSRCPELCLESIISCLIEIQEYDVLWQELWDRLLIHDTYIIALSEHIECDRITFISPIVAQSLCEYWLKVSPEKLEQLIIKMDWKCLDLHQVLTAIKREHLYNAQIFLYTHAFGDYCAPLTDLIPLVLNEENRNLGNYLLVYVSSCLAGRGYPTGTITSDMIASVKHEVLRCLMSIHSNNATDTELPYPYIRTLLKFNTRETLNVLSLAFQEEEFTGELGQSHRQRIVNILLEIMTPENSAWSEIGCLLNFISQQISTRSLPDDNALLNKIVNYLKLEHIRDESPREHFEREQAWLELLENDCLTHISNAEQLKMAENAKCYKVVEYLMEKRKLYDDILKCYLLDTSRHIEIWSYIHRSATQPSRKIYQQIYQHFLELLTINSEELTKIICEYFLLNVHQLIRQLDNNEQALYIFLSELQKQPIPSTTLNPNDYETFLDLLCKYNAEHVDQFLRNNENYRLENALEIVRNYQLYLSCIYLYEKQGDYQSAFNMSLDLLKEAPESMAECRALELNALCSRASNVLAKNECEQLWFTFLKQILPRPDLTQICRTILHSASSHVNLSKLVQLIMNSTGTTNGNFGDIKHLLLGMLSNSQYEISLLQTTAKILDKDLHELLAKEKRKTAKGLYVKLVKCIVCSMRLHNHQNGIIVFSACGHGAHNQCVDNTIVTKNTSTAANGLDDDNKAIITKCPLCSSLVPKCENAQFSEPNTKLFLTNTTDDTRYNSNQQLQLKAPPRIGISS